MKEQTFIDAAYYHRSKLDDYKMKEHYKEMWA